MLLAQRRAVDRQSLQVRSLGLSILPLSPIDIRQIVEAQCSVRMLLAQRRTVECQGLLTISLRLMIFCPVSKIAFYAVQQIRALTQFHPPVFDKRRAYLHMWQQLVTHLPVCDLWPGKEM